MNAVEEVDHNDRPRKKLNTDKTKDTVVTVSAPGKILLCGGYLVLDERNTGLVIAADKRFYSSVRTVSASIGDGSNTSGDKKGIDDKDKIQVYVNSPQFHSTWTYTYDRSNRLLIPSRDNKSKNPFVEKTLRVCLIYLVPKYESVSVASSTDINTAKISSLHVLIRADNDFYSVLPHLGTNSNNNRSLKGVTALPKFLPCPIDPSTGKVVVHKTGLGSSAALTTSLVGALVYNFQQQQDQKEEETAKSITTSAIIHNLAQICHCFAQGKVGSGFDVSAACHGTHVYRRFPKCLLPDLLQQLDNYENNQHYPNKDADDYDETKIKDQYIRLYETIRNSAELVPWKEDMVEELNLPNDLQLMLADVQGGSESPSMAKKVLKWKAEQTEKEVPHWTALSMLNPKIVESIRLLQSGEHAVNYDFLSIIPASDWPSDSPLSSLRDDFIQIRSELRSMGEAAGVPIEPQPQQELCDATSQLPGVIAALVPGAGGFDAVACLYINRPNVSASISNLWSHWKTPVVCPLAVHSGTEGLRLEESECTKNDKLI